MVKQVKIILPEDIEKLGKKWEIKEIKPGFYRFLQEKVWLYSDPKNRRRMEVKKQQEHAAALLKEKRNQEIYQKINNSQLKFILQKDHNDKVAGSIRAEDILDNLEQQHGFRLKKKQLLDFAPLTDLEDSLLKIKLSESLTAQIKITVAFNE